MLNRSPYDVFLTKNALPYKPAPGESAIGYARRLRQRVERLDAPRFVTGADGVFRTHKQSFAFGANELLGLKVFLAEPHQTSAGFPASHVGNCLPCHAPPNFTNFKFHNTGATQVEYDAIHGGGAFKRLVIPGLRERLRHPNDSLPPSPRHPDAAGRFLAVPAPDRPGWVDLGLWNVYANRDRPVPQRALQRLLGGELFFFESPDERLPSTLALFKTPGLRDLGHSAPYMHNGQFDSLEAVMEFYWRMSGVVKAGALRNPDPELRRIAMEITDFAPLAAFLRALNEDFE